MKIAKDEARVLEATQVLEALYPDHRHGSATHAVILEVNTTHCRLRSVTIKDGKPQFFRGAQSRNIPIASIPKRYKQTDMVMKIN